MTPPSADVLGRYFDLINISVEKGLLTAAVKQLSTEHPGLTPYQFSNALFKALALPGVQAAQLNWSRLDLRRLPVLVFFEGCWFTVESSDTETFLLTGDNESKAVPYDDLQGALVLLFSKKQPAKSRFSFSEDIAGGMVFGELFRQKRWLLDVAAATLIVNLLAIATSIFAMQTYDRVVPTLAYATLTTMVVGMLIIVLLDWALKMIRAHILDSVSNDVDKRVSQRVFDHVLDLRMDKKPGSLGTLSAQITGLDSVRQFFSSSVIFSIIDLPFAFLFIFFIYIIGGPVFLVYLALLPVAVVLGWYTQHRLKRLLREQMIRINERQGVLVDAIKGLDSIRTSNAAWRFSEQWKAINESINQYNLKQKLITSFSVNTTGSLSTIAYVSAIVVGVQQIETGNLTMGGLIACSILGGRVIAPVARAVQQIAQWQSVSQTLFMVNSVLKLERQRSPDQHLVMTEKNPDLVRLEDVRFSYGESPVVQLDIPGIEIKAGEKVALLGPIGSGKSTLLKMLAGLYKPSEGRVLLGSIDLWEIDPNKLSELVAYLPQSVSLFKGTLRDNIALSGASSDDVFQKVIAELGLDKVAASTPQGMNMEISEGGEGLSDGQRQLVGLARVFLARPKIWLLDEPTSSLDKVSEETVIEAIRANVRPEDILIVSTHRPMLANTLADRVILLRQGKVIKDGKPEEVLPAMFNQRGQRSAGKMVTRRGIDVI